MMDIVRAEGHFFSRQTELFYQSWSSPSNRATLVLTHGMGEHSESYSASAPELVKLGWNIIAWDLRGHGRSQGKRGHVDHFTDFTSDLSQFLLYLKKNKHLEQPFALLGHSMGGLITLKYLLDETREGASQDPKPLAAVISSPLLDFGLEVPFIKDMAAKVLRQVWPSLTLYNELKNTDLTRDPEWLKTYDKDPLRHDKISPALYDGMINTMRDVRENADQIKLPTAIFAAGTDKIVSISATRATFDKLGSAHKKLIVYDDAYHEIMNDLDRAKVFRDINEFLHTIPGLSK